MGNATLSGGGDFYLLRLNIIYQFITGSNFHEPAKTP